MPVRRENPMRRRQVLTATLSRQANIRAVPVNLSLPVMLWINLGCQMGELLSPPLRGDPRHRDDGTIRSVKCQPRLWCRGQLTDKCRLRVILSRHGWPLPTVPSRRPPAWPRRDIIDHPGLSLPVCPMPPSHLLGPRRKASVNLQYATRVSICSTRAILYPAPPRACFWQYESVPKSRVYTQLLFTLDLTLFVNE